MGLLTAKTIAAGGAGRQACLPFWGAGGGPRRTGQGGGGERKEECEWGVGCWCDDLGDGAGC